MIPQSRLSGVGMYDPPERICIDPLVTQTQIHKYTNIWLKTQINITTGLAAWSYNVLPIRTTTLGLLVTHAQAYKHTQKLTIHRDTKTRIWSPSIHRSSGDQHSVPFPSPRLVSIAIDSPASNLASFQLCCAFLFPDLLKRRIFSEAFEIWQITCFGVLPWSHLPYYWWETKIY